MATKFVFITGGVVSSLGKGITAASLGRLLKRRGLSVSVCKLDPYLNVDPGTMNPCQHGEVLVTDDGAETDLDIGHYERFIDEELTGANNTRRRYEFNNRYKDAFEAAGMRFTGVNEERGLMESAEIEGRPWFVGVQFHPEFKSRPDRPHPLFIRFIESALKARKAGACDERG